MYFFFLLIPPPPSSTLFPYTTLFRSLQHTSLTRRNIRRQRGVPLKVNPPQERLGFDDPAPQRRRPRVVQIRPARQRVRRSEERRVGKECRAWWSTEE